ncbi:MAG: ribonuclease R [Bacillota bacterium]|nr:ribonuclease R [Bacillota bacterium]
MGRKRPERNRTLPEVEERFIQGILSRRRRGFGFVLPSEGGEDVYVSAGNLGSAMNGDLVTVQILGTSENEKNPEGRVVKVLQRASAEVVGTFERQRGYAIVTPENRKSSEEIVVLKKDFNGAKDGDKVVVKVTQWPRGVHSAEGRVMEILGSGSLDGSDVLALIRSFRVREEFPEGALSEAGAISPVISSRELEGRRDLRELSIITMDGADAKDLDDAVSVEKLDNGRYLLGVHIADVSHYVRESGPLDLEALARGCSIYLPDQVIPMLPQKLSNGICSLNPGEDRLTLSVSMEIDGSGSVVRHDLYESVICSRRRMVYDQVSDMLEHRDPALIEEYRDVYPQLLLMEELASVLSRARKDRGSLDFDLEESHITLNSQGVPVSIEAAERRTANRIIEEFMLAANETVAERCYWMDLPFLYRIHEKPAPDRMDELRLFLGGFGLSLKGDPRNVHPRALADILEQVSGQPQEHVVSRVMLRSMKKAVYGTECLGHFGLGVSYYCHFTSPIRRYPDLFIHRVIKESLRGSLSPERAEALLSRAAEAASLSSAGERKADELEREVEKLKKAEFMSSRIGLEYDGVISGAASFGFFVEIENTIEGLVSVNSLYDDHYDFEPEKYRLIGRRRRKIYGLGDPVRVRVEQVDLQRREIDFVLI